MKSRPLLFALALAVQAALINSPFAIGQTPPAAVGLQAPQPQGVQAPWDIQRMLEALNQENKKLKPLLDEMKPQQWLDNGAPPTYASQYLDTRSRMDDVIRSVANLAQHTDSLAAALDTYFRIESLETIAHSLKECIQKYGEKRTAEQLDQLLADSFTNRNRFREYLSDLVKERETEFKVADEEAQRCRGIISRESPASGNTRKGHKQ